MTDLVVLHEHPQWQQPLFDALTRRGVDFAPFDLKQAAFDPAAVPVARLYFNQASPSAYVRGNARAVPLALALLRALAARDAPVLNGADAFAFELSKSAQAATLAALGIGHPRTLAFNDVDAALARWDLWPALLKPEQGGSGARIHRLDGPDDLRRLLAARPDLWAPDHLLLLQELVDTDPAAGIVRLEFLGGELLYAMRVVSHGAFNLCPSEVCHPSGRAAAAARPPVEFHPYPEVPPAAVQEARRIVRAVGLDVAGVEYLVDRQGRRLFHDINANSNLRPAVARHFGFDPFERVVDFLLQRLAGSAARRAVRDAAEASA